MLQTRDIEGLDPYILPVVEILRKHGVETYESCQGGSGHTYLEPGVRFHSGFGFGEAMRTLGIALIHGMPVNELRLSFPVLLGIPQAPVWELVLDADKLHNWLAASRSD